VPSTVTGLRDIALPAASNGRPRIVNALRGHAVIERVSETGATRDGNPEVELRLTVDVPGREPYEATLRQVLSRQVVHALRPGLEVKVAVDPSDPSRLEIG
jgi:hypothetical protein